MTTNDRRREWDKSPWGPGEGKVVYGTAWRRPIAYDCFDRRFTNDNDTYVVGDSDSDVLEIVATLLGRHATGAGARIFVIDYADTGVFDAGRMGGMTIPLCHRPDAGGSPASPGCVPGAFSFGHAALRGAPVTEERMQAVSFRFDDLDGKDRVASAMTALELVSGLSKEEPEAKYICLITGFDRLVADADDEFSFRGPFAEIVRAGRAHRLSVWLMSDRIPDPAEGPASIKWIWDHCSTKLLFPMSAEDAIWCDEDLALTHPVFERSLSIGPRIIQAIAKCGSEAKPGRFAIVLFGGRCSDYVVVDTI